MSTSARDASPFVEVVEPIPTKQERTKAIWQFIAVSLVAGLFASLLGVPQALFAARSVRSGLSVWASMPRELPLNATPQRSQILDRDGKVFATFFSENRVDLESNQIAQVMKDAQVSIEDHRFYSHGAIDAQGLARALVGNIATGGEYGGGSTLTQQYVKNVLLNMAETPEEAEAATERTIGRKLREMRYALGVEEKLTKDEILTGYLNIANYGDGAYGVGAAAQHYFGVPASKLNLNQAATLAGIVQNPSNNPVANMSGARARRNDVLLAMLRDEKITQDEFDATTEAPIELNVTQPANGCLTSQYPYFCQQVRNIISTDPVFGKTQEQRDRVLYQGGLTIRTTLDPKAMKAANDAATRALGNDNQFAAGVAIVQPGTGHVVGIGQNRTFKQTQVSFATSRFQNGSTFKPVTLAAAMEGGWDISKTLDAPTTITKAGKKFGNHGPAAGTMDAARALAISSNTFFVKMETEVTTIPKVQEMARRLGWRIPDNVTGEEAATTLGVYDVSPVETANAYATFAAHGVYCKPTYITAMTGPKGPMAIPDPECHQELEPGVADTIANALTETIAQPYGTGHNLGIDRPAMGKTGTTEGNSSVWFAGGTPQYQVAVWIGDPRGGFKYPVEQLRMYGSTMGGVFGSTAAGPIWRETMRTLHEDVPVENFQPPTTVRQEIVVPNVVGLDAESAITILENAGLTVQLTKSGTVTSQTPGAGTPLSRQGGTVTLTLAEK